MKRNKNEVRWTSPEKHRVSPIVIQPSVEDNPASTHVAPDLLQRLQAYRGHPVQQA